MWSILMRFGIGTADVTTRPQQSVTLGETAEVTVDIEGGKAAQEAEALYVTVETEYEQETEEGTQEVDTTIHTEYPIGEFTIEPDETRTETVEVAIPHETPVTYGYTNVWIEAGLDVDWAADPHDWEYVEVEPDERMGRLFDAIEDLGFTLNEAFPEASGGFFSSGKPFVQEFEYVPRGGPFRSELDELELILDATEDALSVTVEVDRRGGMLSEMTGADESRDVLEIRDQDTDTIADELEALIERNT